MVALAITACSSDPGTSASIEVVRVSGYLDNARLDYIRNSINNAVARGRELVILQIDSPAVIGDEQSLRETVALVADPPLPVVAWLGPAPATAAGGVEQIVEVAPVVAIAPGTQSEIRPDRESPSLRQLVQDLDGQAIGVFPPVRTITDDLPDEQEGVTTVAVTFTQPGLWHRFTHLGAAPASAFFFLVMGLTLAAFEYFALGPGMAAAIAALSLFLGSYGISILPINPWALAVVAVSMWLFATSYQRGGVAAMNLAAAGLLTWSGFNFSSDPAVRPDAIGVIFAILAVLFFFLLAVPAVGRARFSTHTIGREGLIGQTGHAAVDFGPDGVVLINGASWPATAHRESGIREGDQVVVTAVAGREVEVEKSPMGGREN